MLLAVCVAPPRVPLACSACPSMLRPSVRLGSYSKAWVVESELIPVGYFAIAATHGVDHQDNAIGFRVHPDESWQGFRMIEGNVERDYPIIESDGLRSFGVSVRRRGAFVVCQLTAGTYTTPTDFALWSVAMSHPQSRHLPPPPRGPDLPGDDPPELGVPRGRQERLARKRIAPERGGRYRPKAPAMNPDGPQYQSGYPGRRLRG